MTQQLDVVDRMHSGTTKDEMEIISRIAKRAAAMAKRVGVNYQLIDAQMDIAAVHTSGTPLRLLELLETDDANFGHDVFGIRRFLNRSNGQLGGCFVPRFARRGNGR